MGSEEGPCYVIKRWKRDFTHKPPHEQFNFLNEALSLHLPVTRPVGWGTDHSGRSILATDYGGQPVNSPSDQELAVFAFALAKIHKAPIQSIQLQAPKNNQVFLEELLENQFPGLDSQHDILRIMKYLRKNIPAEHFSLIHGDYNLGNLLLKDDRLAVIDWTTSRIGDYRYDLAWSGFLLWIYRNEHSRTVFFRELSKSQRDHYGLAGICFFLNCWQRFAGF